MKKLISILIAATLGVPAFASVYGGAVDTTSTTLSAAIVAGTTTQWCVASATNINTPSISQAGTYLMVGKEVVQVMSAGSSTTCFNVKRGQLGTSSAYPHAAGQAVWVGNVATGAGDSSRPFSGGAFTANVPEGTCVASQQYSLPLVIYGPPNGYYSGKRAYCYSGYWTIGEGSYPPAAPYTTFTTISPPVSIATSSVTDVAGKMFFDQLSVPFNASISGLCVLNGATVGTDKWVMAIWDGAGNVLGTTALAGTTTAVASKYQCIALVNPISITGPGTYFVGVQGNGTTDNFQAYATGGAPTNYATGSKTGSFGTITAITPTTTFTAALGPVMMTY